MKPLAGNKWADMTPEQQTAQKQKMAEGRAAAFTAKREEKRLTAERAAEVAATLSWSEPAAIAIPEEAVIVKSIAVPGIVMDDQGNKWTIPADSLDDDIRLYKSDLRVPNPDPRFYYQFEHKDNIGSMGHEQFVPVTLKEQGLDKYHVASDYGVAQDGYFRVGDLVCIKTPKELEQRRRRAEKKMVDESVKEVGISSKVKADSGDHQTQVELRRGDSMIKRPAHQSQGV